VNVTVSLFPADVPLLLSNDTPPPVGTLVATHVYVNVDTPVSVAEPVNVVDVVVTGLPGCVAVTTGGVTVGAVTITVAAGLTTAPLAAVTFNVPGVDGAVNAAPVNEPFVVFVPLLLDHVNDVG
jgi:hypothetical protein